MRLNDVKTNVHVKIVSLNIDDYRMNLRLKELGMIEGCEISIYSRSIFKHTLIIIFNSNVFTLKDNVAKLIEVEYV